MIRACIFDLGGTIIDRYSLSPLISLHQAFKRNKIDIPTSLIAEDMGLRKVEHIETILDKSNVKPLWYRETSDIPKSVMMNNILKEFNQQQSNAMISCKLIPETFDIMNYLQLFYSAKIGITTGFNFEHTSQINRIFEDNDIHFDSVVSSDCVERSRPYEDMILKNMNNLDIRNPKQIIKIDDTAIGIEEGNNAGCHTVGVARWSINMNMYDYNDTIDNLVDFNEIQTKLKHSRKCLDNADYVIDTLDELPKVIMEINRKNEPLKQYNNKSFSRQSFGRQWRSDLRGGL